VDLYQILGVGAGASRIAVKAAYRARAKQFHPDSGGDPERFRLIKLAYDVLSDADLRERYDSTGEIPDHLHRSLEDDRLNALAGEVLLAAVTRAGAPQFDDVIDLMRDIATGEMTRLTYQITITRQLVDKISMVMGRIRSKGSENVLSSALLNRQAGLRRQIGEAESQHELYRRLLGMLDGYTYERHVDSVTYATVLRSRAWKPGGDE
jgi:curved DNA-binding protein CbpA